MTDYQLVVRDFMTANSSKGRLQATVHHVTVSNCSLGDRLTTLVEAQIKGYRPSVLSVFADAAMTVGGRGTSHGRYRQGGWSQCRAGIEQLTTALLIHRTFSSCSVETKSETPKQMTNPSLIGRALTKCGYRGLYTLFMLVGFPLIDCFYVSSLMSTQLGS